MAWSALTLTGYLKMGTGSGLTSGQLVDVSEQVTAMTIIREVATIEVPATLATSKGARKGSVTDSLQIDFLSANNGVGVWSILEAAATATDGVFCWEARVKDDAASATNPTYRGECIVAGAQIGGTAEELMTSSQTHRMVSTYSKSTS